MYRDLNGIHIAIILCSLFAIITVTTHMYKKRQLLLSQLNIYRITFNYLLEDIDLDKAIHLCSTGIAVKKLPSHVLAHHTSM